jgi:hypothetical protein
MNSVKTIITKLFISLSIVTLIGCDIQEKKERKSKSTYVKPYVTQSGKLCATPLDDTLNLKRRKIINDDCNKTSKSASFIKKLKH